MLRIVHRPVLLIIVLALLAASCGDDDAAEETSTTLGGDSAPTTSTTEAASTSTTEAATTSTTTTTAAPITPASPTLAVQGDRNETVEAVQFLLNCNGHGDLTLDGAFGPATLAAVQAAEAALGSTTDGVVDEDLMAALARTCAERRTIEGEEPVTLVGNTAPGDPEEFSVALLSDSTVSITVILGTAVSISVTGADGTEAVALDETTWQAPNTQEYVIEVESPAGPITFTIEATVTPAEPELGDWIIATDGLTYDGTELTLGDDAGTVIDQVFDFLGHGVRGALDEFDTDWYAITDPQDMGLRGILIEGFAFLFFGPDPNNPDRPETWARLRFEGPTVDADGNPRPENYATTAEGITVGDTLADLQAAYGGDVSGGSNSEEYYYRYTDSGGELCFYFDTEDEPGDFDEIVEIATECRN